MSVPEEITFKSVPTRVGQVTMRTSEQETRMVLMVPGPDGTRTRRLSTMRARHVRREQVVAVRGSVTERLRVTFIEDVTTVETDGRKERTVGPLVGNTFEVERKGARGTVAVYDARGAPARFGVAAQVAGHFRHFGRAIEGDLPVGAQQIGQSSPELAGSLVAGISRGTAVTEVAPPVATLVEIRPAPDGSLHGVYDVEVKVTGESSGSQVAMHLKGTLTLRDVDGALIEVRLLGPVNTSPEDDAGGSHVAPGTGQFKLVQTMAYAQA